MSSQNNLRAAALTSALLARKGGAAPAGPNAAGLDAMARDLARDLSADHPVHHARPAPAATPCAPEPAPAAQASAPLPAPEAAARAGEPAKAARRRASPGSGGKAAMTVRLDAERHFKLRLMSAHANRSAQQILVAALDDYLAKHGADISPRMCACATAIG